MLIVNPSFGQAAGGGETIERKPVDWKTDAIALFSNSKPNARELLEGVKATFSTSRTVENINYVSKASVAHPAPDDVIQHVAENYRAALLAIAD
ncbi:MAG: hypothetical protein HOI95_26285 [Chromatiales bacterium]|jgi:hypothetical protein|nr:hypothetical protein [Chromatiales bacterium]